MRKKFKGFLATAAGGFAALLATSLCVSCASNEEHFISDASYRSMVEKDFEAKRALMDKGNLFTVFDQQITTQEREALEFLYAYMPLNDITDKNGEFYLDAVRTSFKAKAEMPWGKQIPEREFRHFVLPLRVNNENLDSCRAIFYDELKERIKNMTLADAVLEVNHWCHEKVVYRPSDARTSSPLATVKTAFGRCGEESTFTVAALRAVGIPARQVYTPRWAHTDDNHAWVEAWVDGKWHFFGACEPEPVLDLAWFNAPASRGMLMHTNVFGKYDGAEEVMRVTNTFTEINVTDNYAPTSKIDVTVVDNEGKPVENAEVEFKLYNYAEFYSVAKKLSDAEGRSSLTAGKGDILVWASKDGNFGYQKASIGKDTRIEVKLDMRAGGEYAVNFDLVPPAEGSNLPKVTDEQKAENNIRLAEEDDIRNKYIATFLDTTRADSLARLWKVDAAQFVNYIALSRGNWETIVKFVENATPEQRPLAMELLSALTEKDLRDVSITVLEDNLLNTPAPNATSQKGIDAERFRTCLLNPRVSYEMLTPYKKFLQTNVPAGLAAQFKKDPASIFAWCKDSIRICDAWNPSRYIMSPEGVWRSRLADERSRSVFFVALCRAMGVPAWLDMVTGKYQYAANGQVLDVDFKSGVHSIAPQGVLVMNYEPLSRLKDPKYYTHFSIAKIVDGKLSLLNFDEDGTATWEGLFKNGVDMDEGSYALVTGTRLANGSVLARMSFFNIAAGKTTNVKLDIRNDDTAVQVIGSFDSESLFKEVASGNTQSVLATTGRGYYVVAVLGAKEEPTNHFLKDLAAVGGEFDKWGRQMVMLFPSENNYERFDISEFPGLPKNITWGIDPNRSIANKIIEGMELDSAGALPLIIISDTFNRVVFVSQGYNIGTAERMLDVIHKL